MKMTEDYLHLVIDKCIKADPNFDICFLESLSKRLEDGKNLTEKQENAVENIIRGYKLDI